MSAASTQESDFHTKDHTGLPAPKNGATYMRPAQAKEMQGQIDHINGMLRDPTSQVVDPGAMKKRVAGMQKMLDVQAAPLLNPEQMTIAARQEKALREKIRGVMCSGEEMRKCPPGAVGKYTNGEASTEMKTDIQTWKNTQMMLDPENTDPDLCNAEQFRPRTSTLNMDNAQIPGRSIFPSPNTEQYKTGWDQTFGEPEENPAVLALQKELAELRALIPLATVPVDTLPDEADIETANEELPIGQEMMDCGKVLHSKGQRMHRRTCKKGCTPMEDQ